MIHVLGNACDMEPAFSWRPPAWKTCSCFVWLATLPANILFKGHTTPTFSLLFFFRCKIMITTYLLLFLPTKNVSWVNLVCLACREMSFQSTVTAQSRCSVYISQIRSKYFLSLFTFSDPLLLIQLNSSLHDRI